MQGLALDRWYKGLVTAAVAMIGVGAVAKDKPLIVLALGLLAFGTGAWINHATQQGMGVMMGQIVKTSKEVRAPKPLGIVLEIIGGLLALLGAGKLVLGLL